MDKESDLIEWGSGKWKECPYTLRHSMESLNRAIARERALIMSGSGGDMARINGLLILLEAMQEQDRRNKAQNIASKQSTGPSKMTREWYILNNLSFVKSMMALGYEPKIYRGGKDKIQKTTTNATWATGGLW